MRILKLLAERVWVNPLEDVFRALATCHNSITRVALVGHGACIHGRCACVPGLLCRHRAEY